VTKLLNKGADVKVTNKSGSTPLHYAAANGHREVVASWRCC
jgi:ankyrin repeat protein